MKNWKAVVTLTTMIASSAGIALGADETCDHSGCDMSYPDSIASIKETTIRQLAEKMIHSLSPMEQQAIVDGHGIGSAALDLSAMSWEVD